jgi:hypothetical protein
LTQIVVAAEESWQQNNRGTVAARDTQAIVNRRREKKKEFGTEQRFLPYREGCLFLIQQIAFLRDVYCARNLSNIEKPLRPACF